MSQLFQQWSQLLLLVAVWQVFKTNQLKEKSRLEIAQDEAYRKLAEESLSVQQKMALDLANLSARITSIEKILSEVN